MHAVTGCDVCVAPCDRCDLSTAGIDAARGRLVCLAVPILTFDVINAYRYYARMTIRSFADADTRDLFNRVRVRRFASIERPALRKLKQLDLARGLADMRAPPGNRLEALKGERAGQWSVRINDQFRVCFRWDHGPEDVEIVDYH